MTQAQQSNAFRFVSDTLDHLIKQGTCSYGEYTYTDHDGEPDTTEGCLYRGPNGTKCAVGFHIEDSEYLYDMEDKNAADAFAMVPGARLRLAAKYDLDATTLEEIACVLQTVHDSTAHSVSSEYHTRLLDAFLAMSHGSLGLTPEEKLTLANRIPATV